MDSGRSRSATRSRPASDTGLAHLEVAGEGCHGRCELPRPACSRSIASNSALKVFLPKPRDQRDTEGEAVRVAARATPTAAYGYPTSVTGLIAKQIAAHASRPISAPRGAAFRTPPTAARRR